MHITPFISDFLSSCANQGYSVFINRDFIKIKITPFEFFVIKQDNSGKSYFLLFRHGDLHSLSADYIYDYLFSYDEYGLRLYDKSLGG
ncbi:TPA: hypothetical protein ACQ8V3_004654 [Escherichia coli]|nr:hypothetical protein [Escherichia coli]ELP4036583.1 hypothetical protein [Escherichia coli]HCO8324055.1 hypothetical protein [Escherichia coli]HEF0828324.1 hypothetical protein [Escherichia coli]